MGEDLTLVEARHASPVEDLIQVQARHASSMEDLFLVARLLVHIPFLPRVRVVLILHFVFQKQPHLFTRTRDFIDDFAVSLSKFDSVRLLDIYPARELPISGVTSEWLLGKVDHVDKKLIEKEEAITEIKNSDAPIVVMLGAGDIGVLIEEVTKELIG